MTDKTIINIREVGGDYFRFYYSRKGGYNLEHFLTFDPELYWIYKTTNIPREVSYEEFLKFKYAGYTFFKKELYNKNEINKWIEIIKSWPGSVWWLNKPLPPTYIIEKIKIKK